MLTFKSSTQEEDLWVWGQPALRSKFQDSLGYTEKPCVENKQKKYLITLKFLLLFIFLQHVFQLIYDLRASWGQKNRFHVLFMFNNTIYILKIIDYNSNSHYVIIFFHLCERKSKPRLSRVTNFVNLVA